MNEEMLFEEALSRSPEERTAFLEQVCAGRPDLRAAVEALLTAHEKSSNTLDRPPDVSANSASGLARSDASLGETPRPDAAFQATNATADYCRMADAGLVIAGRYTLQERIGEGGMGEVWVAKQTDPVKRKVALKLIKAGMDSRAVLQRFDQERQALALMDHPNIARVLDGGLTPTGQPFFVMELVNGLPLTRFCDEARLTPRDRLKLFAPICQAVQHAHQKGIVHRDLKPANILVTLVDGNPEPKVIDFGVAKAIAGKLTDESLSTQLGSVVGTLEYMAPEQAGFSGEDIDTRADIYSLGVILYELLTGLRPIDARRLKNAAITEMIRIIKEEEPSKPSTRLSTDESLPSTAAVRQIEPRRLMAMLRGELDWVVMKCLEKGRERRYQTANGLSRDIERYLADEPVEARPPSAGYRIRKFVKRHKRTAIATSFVLLALVVGIAGTTYGLVRAEIRRKEAERAQKAEAEQRARAESERNKALAAERESGIERDKAVAAEAKTRAINDFLTQDLLTQAEPANSAAEDHVTLLEVLDRAATKVGQRFADQPGLESALRATIAGTYHGLASWEKAEAQWRSLLEAAQQRDPQSADFYLALDGLAHILRHRGRRDTEAVKLAETAAEGLKRTLGPDHSDTLAALHNLASVYWDAGRLPDAVALLERVRNAKIAKLGGGHPDTLGTLNNLATAYQRTGKLAEAIALFERVRDAKLARLGPDHPDTLTTLSNLAGAYGYADRLAEAIALFERVRDAQLPRLGPDHPLTLTTLDNLAQAYQQAGRLPEAIALHERVRDARIARLGPDHPETLMTLNNLATDYWWVKRLDLSVPLFEQVLKQRVARLGRQHPDTQGTVANLGVNYKDAGQLDAAIPLLEEAWRASANFPYLRWVGAPLLESYVEAGRKAEAVKLVAKLLADARQSSPKDNPELAKSLAESGRMLLLVKAYADAEPLLRECLAVREKTQPDLWNTFTAKSMLGGALLGQKKYAEAEPFLVAGYQGMDQREATIPVQAKDRLTEALERLVQLYEATGKLEDAARWRKELESRKAAAEPATKKP
jgi:serine/threonine protein kinase/tetratricopeptide (TPR) repeat protein